MRLPDSENFKKANTEQHSSSTVNNCKLKELSAVFMLNYVNCCFLLRDEQGDF